MKNEIMSLDEIKHCYPAHGVSTTFIKSDLLRSLCNAARAYHESVSSPEFGKETSGNRENISSWPAVIYLQEHEDVDVLSAYDQCDIAEVTWCRDQTVACAVCYVRADLVETLKKI